MAGNKSVGFILSAIAVAGATAAFGYDASTITAVDWAATAAAGTSYTVPAGQTNLVTEADIANFNLLTDVAFGSSASALIFTSSTPPKALWNGAGTLVKEGSGVWTLPTVQTKSSWCGVYDIRAGVVTNNLANGYNSCVFSSSTSSRSHLYIREGATFVLAADVWFLKTRVHIGGTYINRFHTGSACLQGGVEVESDSAELFQDGYYTWFSTASAGTTSCDLKGHTLTIRLNKFDICLHKGQIAGPGRLRIVNESTGSSPLGLTVRNTDETSIGADVVMEMGDKTKFVTQSHATQSPLAKLEVVAGATVNLQHRHNSNSIPKCPRNCAGSIWAGPVELKGADSRLNVDYLAVLPTGETAYPESDVAISGKISGLGTIAIGSQGSYCSSQAHYHLTNAANDFAGKILMQSGTTDFGTTGNFPDATFEFAGGAVNIQENQTVSIGCLSGTAATKLNLAAGSTLATTNVIPSETSTLFVTLTQGEGSALDFGSLRSLWIGWLKVGSLGGYVASDGRLVGLPVQPTDEIAARGGVIPNSHAAAVAITTDGAESAGPITLEESPATIQSLAQATSADATVDLTDATLTVDQLTSGPDAGALTLGCATGAGAVKASAGALEVTADSPITVAATLDAAVTSIRKLGSSVLALLSLDDGFAGKFTLQDGTTRLSGACSLVPSAFTYSIAAGTALKDVPTCVLDGDAKVRFDDTVSYALNGNNALPGHLVITNGASFAATNNAGNAGCKLWFGNDAPFILDVEEGGSFSSRVKAWGCGGMALRQRGGAVTLTTGGYAASQWAANSQFSCAAGYYFYQELSGGTFTGESSDILYAYPGTAHIQQTGGSIVGQTLDLGFSAGGFAMMNCEGGTVKLSGNLALPRASTDNASSTGCVCIAKSAVVTAASVRLAAGITNCCGTVLLRDGGVLASDVVARYKNMEVACSETSFGGLYFDGGVLRTTQDEHVFGQYSYEERGTTKGYALLSEVVVFAGNAIFETTKQTAEWKRTCVDVPLAAPTGKGVKSFEWPAAVPTTEIVGPPTIRIYGDGHGAVAVADYDRETFSVTNVTILCPGSGYTWAKAEVRYENKKRATVDCTLTDGAPASGGLVKRGIGKLDLCVPNTYTGETVVEGGTLQLSVAGALPAASALVLKGGIVTASSGVTIPSVRFDCPVGTTLDYTAAFAIPSGSTIRVTGTPAPDEYRYTLMTWTNLSGVPSLVWENAAAYPGWKLRIASNKMKLVRRKGLAVIFR